jgi:hypothetical protein
MSMLTFYINRAGKNLSAARRRNLEKAGKAAGSVRTGREITAIFLSLPARAASAIAGRKFL